MATESVLNRTDWTRPLQGRKNARRLVSFRIAEDQYATLTKVSALTGARSISDFARYTVLNGMESAPTATGSLQCDLTTLAIRLREIDAQLKATRSLIARILGAESVDAEEKPCGALPSKGAKG